MKVFFVASLHGKEKYEENYRLIVKTAEEAGCRIQADHVLDVTKQQVASWDTETNLKYHRKIMDGIKKCDILFAEMSYPSTSVGYLLSLAVESVKPVVMFYSGKEEPHLLPTLEAYDRLQLIQYTGSTNLKEEIALAIDYASGQMDTRFNFFISPKIAHYLDWVSKEYRLPRAVFLRKLIEEDMERYQEERNNL